MSRSVQPEGRNRLACRDMPHPSVGRGPRCQRGCAKVRLLHDIAKDSRFTTALRLTGAETFRARFGDGTDDRVVHAPICRALLFVFGVGVSARRTAAHDISECRDITGDLCMPNLEFILYYRSPCCHIYCWAGTSGLSVIM